MDIEEMKRQRARLDEQIRQAEKSKADMLKELALQASYTKVVCADCDGTGETSEGGADIESDPPFAVTCRACHGEGWLYARKFERLGRHDLEHNQVIPGD